MSDTVTIAELKKPKAARSYAAQLLPNRYFARKHASRVFCIWVFVVFSLLSAMLGILVPIMLQGNRVQAKNSRLIADSLPLRDNVIKTQQLKLKNARYSQWNTWVESAKPDDSLLQIVAATAAATDANKTGIAISTLNIQLPVEYPANSPRIPKWATPQYRVSAKVKDGKIAKSWITRLNASDRIEDAASRLPPGTWKGGTVQITAKPLATRMLP